MSTIITRNSATSGSTPSSLIQGELAINVTDGRLFYGSGSGNVVKEFTASGSGGGAIDTGSFVTTSSFNAYTGSNDSQFAGTASYALTASYVLTSVAPSLQQVVNVGNSLVNFGGLGTASLLSVNFVNNRSLYLNDDSYPTIRLVDNNNASNNLQIDIDTISLDGVSYNWSDIVNSTASYALQALSASYALTASYLEGGITINTGSFATTGSNIFIGNQIITGSLHQSGTFYPDQINWFSSSIGYDTGSYILTTTANGLTTYANYQDVANTLAPYIPTVNSSVSASYAETASYIPNAIVTASVSSNTITFTKGNGTTFPITVNTGSGGGGAVFPYTGSAIISGSLEITGSLFVQDINGIINIDSENRKLYDTITSQSVNWEERRLYDNAGNRAVAWQNKVLGDSSGGGSVAWDYPNLTQAVKFSSYTRNNIDLGVVGENFANFPAYAAFQPQGEILKNGVTFDAAVADFDLVYLETDNTWHRVNVTTTGSRKMLGVAFGIANFDNQVLIEGTMVVNDNTYTDTPIVDGVDHGLPIYIKTGGATFMSTTPPGSSGDNVRVLGHAYYNSTTAGDYWIMKFRPSNSWVTI